MLLIPPNAAELAKLVPREEGQHAARALRVTQTEDGYRVEACDGRVLAVAEGDGFSTPAG
jgi:hypothetical protein